jgi:O-antigen/teichoic acid export membrane protein
MSLVFRQSFANTLLTYGGFILGAVNYMWLYLRFMTDSYFGLVGVVLSTAAILTPIMSFGIPNTLVKFYSGFTSQIDQNRFLSYCFILPLLVIFPLAGISSIFNEAIGAFLARRNAIVENYVWHIFLIGMAMAYFEVFFAWSKISLKSVFGTFLKEIFIRAGTTGLLIGLYFQIFSEITFLQALVGLYLLRTLIMFWSAKRLRPIQFDLSVLPNRSDILKYTVLIIVGGSVSVLLLEVDRFMINQYIPIENVAYYSLAVFMATVIIVPWRAMHQITYPITASLLNAEDWTGLANLYRKTSLHLFMLAGWLFMLLILNLESIYELVPQHYKSGAIAVIIIGAIKVYDSFLGINTAILYNSKYYISLLLMGAGLAILTVGFNMFFIPEFGISGAAYATALAVVLYNSFKLAFVWIKMSLHPISKRVLTLLGLFLLTGILTYSLPIDFTPFVDILLRSLVITVFYGFGIWILGISPEFKGLILSRISGKKNPEN